MMSQIMPYIFYAVGSVCFFVGTVLAIIQIMREVS